MKDSWIVQFQDGKFHRREEGMYTDIPDGKTESAHDWAKSKGFSDVGDTSYFPAWPIWLNDNDGWQECCYMVSIHHDFSMEVWIDNPLDVLLFESQYLAPLQTSSNLCDPSGLKIRTGTET